MNYFKPITQNHEPISPPDEPENWVDNYFPTREECDKAKDMFKDFKRELACSMNMGSSEWDDDDYDALFEILVW